MVPIASTVHDLATLLTGRNAITDEDVGFGGRGVALVGLVTPASGGQVRGLLKGGKYVLSEATQRVARGYTNAALQRTYRGAIREINRHKEILSKANPQEVKSITEDLVKHERRLQSIIEEMGRRDIHPRE